MRNPWWNNPPRPPEQPHQGSETVEQTLTGMQTIKTKVDVSAEKVLEMGARSDQIGEIVTTIEDIASQTNSARSERRHRSRPAPAKRARASPVVAG